MMNLLSKPRTELDRLALEYHSLKKRMAELSEKESEIVERLATLADEHLASKGQEKKEGTITLKGENWDVKVQKRINIRYPKERGAAHPLVEAVVKFNELNDMVNISASERGKDIQKMMDRVSTEGPQNDMEAHLAAIREETQGKPGITVIEKQ